MKKILLPLIIGAISFTNADAITLEKVRFHNEASDTTRITEILINTTKQELQLPGERISYIAKQFLNTPYVAGTLEGESELLTVNMSELDCTTFVETVMAMAYTIGEGRSSWRDYIYNLERIRYRKGELDGYSSRLHYISDWIVDNSYRGNFSEATTKIPNHTYIVKSIDFMSSHRDSYAALTDSIEFSKMKNIEIGYRNHRFPYIKRENLRKKDVKSALKEGDIIALTTRTNGLDVSHMGIITIVDSTPHLLHASMSARKVIIDPLPLHEYLMKGRSLTGIRVIRLNEN